MCGPAVIRVKVAVTFRLFSMVTMQVLPQHDDSLHLLT